MAAVQKHPEAGFDILKNIAFPWNVAQIVLQHHERMNGSGYPNGLTSEQIVPEAHILAVADVVEAMCSYRPYRTVFSIDIALQEITDNKGGLYDPDVVNVCLSLFQDRGFSFQQNP